MSDGAYPVGASDSDVSRAIDQAIDTATAWFRGLAGFPTPKVYGGGTVVGSFGPTILGEEDAVLHTARILADCGIPWDHMHLELALTKWLWAKPHPAADLPGQSRIDLAVISPDALQAADLPDTTGSLTFDAFLEFKYASGFWQYGVKFGFPAKLEKIVQADIDKMIGCLEAGICRAAHVVCFEQVDHHLPDDLTARAQERHPGLRVHIIRAWQPG